MLCQNQSYGEISQQTIFVDTDNPKHDDYQFHEEYWNIFKMNCRIYATITGPLQPGIFFSYSELIQYRFSLPHCKVIAISRFMKFRNFNFDTYRLSARLHFPF